MAKWTFEDIANGAMAIVGVALIAKSYLEARQIQQDADDEHAADRFVDATKARMRAMHEYILRNHGSKETYVEAFTAAKNVIQFDVQAELPGNVYSVKAIEVINAYIDHMIAAV